MVEALRLDVNSGVGWTSDLDGAMRVVVGKHWDICVRRKTWIWIDR